MSGMKTALASRPESENDEQPAGPRKRPPAPEISPDRSDAYTWYALRVQPQRELSVARILHDVGFASFTPVAKRWEFPNRQTRARWEKREVIRPIMPGWCFVGFARHTPGWESIVWIPAVTAIVCQDGSPAPVPHDSVRRKDGSIRRPGLRELIVRQADGRFNAPDYQRWQETQATFQEGDRVVGILADETGDHLRATVVSIKGRDLRVELDRAMFGAVQVVESDVTRWRKAE